MPKIALNDGTLYDLDQDLANQGVSVVGTEARGLGSHVPFFKHDVVYKIKDKDGKEKKFDAYKYLKDKGFDPDMRKTKDLQDEEELVARKASEKATNERVKRELEQFGRDNGEVQRFMRTALPTSAALVDSDGGKGSEGVMGAAKAGVTGVADVMSFVGRGMVGAYDVARKNILGEDWRPDFEASMAKTPEYGADDDNAPLSENLAELGEAFRKNPAGVLADIGRESVRDPFTGLALASTLSTGGLSGIVSGSRSAMIANSIAKTYRASKKTAQVANAIQRSVKSVMKTAEKLEKMPGLKGKVARFAADVTGGTLGEGSQGVIMNWAMNADKDTWNTFVNEGVEGAIFDGAFKLTGGAIGAAWDAATPAKKKQILNDMRQEAQQKKAEQAQDDILFEETVADAERVNEQATSSVPPDPDANVTPIADDPTQAGLMDDFSSDPMQQTEPMDALPPPEPSAEAITAMSKQQADGSTTYTPAGPVSILAPLPAGISRIEMQKKHENPAYLTEKEREIVKKKEKADKQARATLAKIKADTEKLEAEISANIEKMQLEAEADIAAEDAKMQAENEKVVKQFEQDYSAISDPTKLTPYHIWRKYFGKSDFTQEQEMAEFTKFTRQEQSKIDKIKGVEQKTANRFGTAEDKAKAKEAIKSRLRDNAFASDLAEIGRTPEQYKAASERTDDLIADPENFKGSTNTGRYSIADSQEVEGKGAFAALDYDVGEAVAPAFKKTDSGYKRTAIGRYVNHSREPNSSLELQENGDISIVSKRPLGAGEEITVDYRQVDAVKKQVEAVSSIAKASNAPTQRRMKPSPKKRKPIQVFDESKEAELKALLQAKLAKMASGQQLSVNPLFDPELITLGFQYGGILIQKGFNKAADWTEAMAKAIGKSIEPYLKSIWAALNVANLNSFDPDIASEAFRFGGILYDEGATEPKAFKEAMLSELGEGVAPYIDAVFLAIENYPTEINQEGVEDGTNDTAESPETEDAESSDERSPADDMGRGLGKEDVETSSGGIQEEGGGDESGIRSDSPVLERDTSELGITSGGTLLANNPTTPAEGREAGVKFKDPSLKYNLDLRNLEPVELTKGLRIEANNNAIEILKRLDTDPNSYSVEDREALRHYTGLGGLDASKVAVDESEHRGTLYQHYTSYQTSSMIYKALDKIGFNLLKKGLVALEPTAGIGNFMGFMPEIKWRSVEMDETSAKVMKWLYPKADVAHQPFESYRGEPVDLVITNVPFLEQRGAFAYLEKDPAYKSISSLHNYIINKSVDQLRDNGLGVFITSTGTMDAKGSDFRQQLNQKCEVLAVLRLPGGTFEKNADYAGTADLLIMRKRTKGEIAEIPAEQRIQPEFVQSKSVTVTGTNGNTAEANMTRWFDEHPMQLLGTLRHGYKTKFLTQATVMLETPEGISFEQAYQSRFEKGIDGVKYEPAYGAVDDSFDTYGAPLGDGSPDTPINGLEVINGRVARKLKDGKLYPFRPDGETYSIPESVYVKLADILRLTGRLFKSIREGLDVNALQAQLREDLEAWRSITYPKRAVAEIDGKVVGLLPGVVKKRSKIFELRFDDKQLSAWVDQDPRWWQLSALYSKNKNTFSSFLMDKPATVKATETVKLTSPSDPQGVVDFVIGKYGTFDQGKAQAIYKGDKPFVQAMLELPEMNWHDGQLVHDMDYLVGNLRDKIKYAQAENLEGQLIKLQTVLPEQVTAETIDPNVSASWFSDDARTAFMFDLLGRGKNKRFMLQRFKDENGKLKYKVIVDGKAAHETTHAMQYLHKASFADTENKQQLIDGIYRSIDEDQKGRLYALVDVMLNSRNPYYNIQSDDKVVKIEAPEWQMPIKQYIESRFASWLRVNPEYANESVKLYNESFRMTSTLGISQEKMFVEGLASNWGGKDISPYAHQYAAVRMAIYKRAGGLAWGVGYGKTLGAILQFAALRTKWVKKGCFVVPGKTQGMWAAELNRFIPGVQVKLIRGSEQTTRLADLQDARQGEHEVIVISHESFSSIPLQSSADYVSEEIKEIRSRLMNVDKKDKKLKKDLEKKIEKLTDKLNSIIDETRDPRTVKFEELNVDAIWVDEAHNYKNYYEFVNEFSAKPFVPKSESNRGNDIVWKTKYIHEKNDGQGGVFLLSATLTPNNPIEAYKMVKLVAPKELDDRGVPDIDTFIRNFMDTGTGSVTNMSGSGTQARELILGLRNGSGLQDIIKSYIDVKLTVQDDMKALRPGEQHETVAFPMTDEQNYQMAEIVVISETIASLKGKAKQDYMKQTGYTPMVLTSIAKNISIDPAMNNEKLLIDEPNFFKRSAKAQAMMDKVSEHFKKFDRNQLIFIDLYKVNSTVDTGVDWPSGFGRYSVFNEGKESNAYPAWMRNFEGEERVALLEKMNGSPDLANFPKNAKGVPFKVEKNEDMSGYRPVFHTDGRITIGERKVAQNLHEEVMKYAVDKIGIPADRVIIVNGEKNNKPADKTALEERVSNGDISLIIGSRKALGEGMNLQYNGDAIHQYDVPWTPKDITQSNGRFIRARENDSDPHPISVYYYTHAGSLDARMYEVLSHKEEHNRKIWTEKFDKLDNSIENIEEEGFNPSEISESAKISSTFIDGFKLLSAVKTLRKSTKDKLEAIEHAKRAINRFDEQIEKSRNVIANSRERINNRNIKFEAAVKEYTAKKEQYEKDKIDGTLLPEAKEPKVPEPAQHDHDLELIERNSQQIELLTQDKKPYERTLESLAEADLMLNEIDVIEAVGFESKKNKFQKFLGEIADNVFAPMITRLQDGIKSSFQSFATANALGRVEGDITEKDVKKIRDYLHQKQGGNAALKVLGTIAAGTLAVPLFMSSPSIGAAAIAAAGGFWAYKSIQKGGLLGSFVQSATYSIEGRLRATPGWANLEPKFDQAYREHQYRTANDLKAYHDLVKKLTKEQKEVIADVIEREDKMIPFDESMRDAIESGDATEFDRAVSGVRKLLAKIVPHLNQVGFKIEQDRNYFPRVFNKDNMRKLKDDPIMFDKNVAWLMQTQKMDKLEAISLLFNFFDFTEDMRIERAAKNKYELFRKVLEGSPNIDPVQLNKVYANIKNKFGERVSGNLRFSRRAPALHPMMYVRNVDEVVPHYLDRAWKTISYRRFFGSNLELLRSFINKNWPIIGDAPSAERIAVNEYFTTEMYAHKFAPMLGKEKNREAISEASRNIATFHVYTKLFTSPLSVVKNILFGTTMSPALAGFVPTARGVLNMLTVGGWENAKIAGAISDDLIRDAYSMHKGDDSKLLRLADKASQYMPFTYTEKFVRGFSFHAGRHQANRLFDRVMKGDKAAKEQLSEMIGERRLNTAVLSGVMPEWGADLCGLRMSELVAGTTRPLKLPRWMNTPEGAIIFQFRRMAYAQTRNWWQHVIKPLRRGKIAPFIAWGTMVGINTAVMNAIVQAVYGDDDREEDEVQSGPIAWAYALMHYTQVINAFGLISDISNGLDTGDQYGDTPLVGTFAGPTVGGALHFARDIVIDAGLKGEPLGNEIKQNLRRQVVLLNFYARQNPDSWIATKEDKE